MTENVKTITFVVVGLVAIAIGVFTRPTSAELDEQTLVGQNLTKSFDSADEAKRLKIVRFNEDTATLREFEVAEKDGLWTIPSKDGYPADAAQQMAEAATSLMDRKILSVASMSAGDHEQFGVIDPQSPKLEVGQKGVGTHVTVYDVHDTPLADLIVGKAVKGADAQRYVREAGRDIVYVVEIDPAKLSTNFEDWIEKDLLKLNAWDLQQVQVKDYSAELVPVMTQQGLRFSLRGDMRSDMTLAYNDSDAKWSTVKLRQFDPQTETYTDFMLAEDQELNAESLNGLKTALDDLKIVDVERKPQGLSSDLKAGDDFMKNEDALRSLVSKGFTPTQSASGSGAEELISSDGEVIATTKNGTEYVLRFGNLTNAGAGDKEKEKASATDAAPADKEATAKGSDVHRYLFVTARFNEDAVKRPELKSVPDLPAKQEEPASDDSAPAGNPAEGAKPDEPAADEPAADEPAADEPAADETAADEKAADEKAADEKAADEKAPDEKAPDEKAPDEKAPDEKAPDASSEKTDKPAEDTTQGAAEGAQPPADSPQTEATAESPDQSAGKDDENKSDATPAGEASDSTGSPKKEGDAQNADSDKTKELEKLVAERKRIEQENKRKTDDYQQLLEKGRENVKELNLRFGDWYFVVADDVFKKIRLSREDVIKKKEKKEDAAKPDSAGGKPGGSALPVGVPGLPPIPPAQQ